MEYAIITKRISIDPTYVLRGYIKQPDVTHARPLTESEKKVLMLKLNAYGGSISTRNVIYAELSGDFPLGDSRQPIYKSLRPFDLVS